MVDTICDPKMIMEWGGLTQVERAVRLHRIHPQVKITGQYLGQIYKRYGIKRKAVILQKIMSKQFRGKINKRIAEAKENLLVELQNGYTVYYLDECMFTT